MTITEKAKQNTMVENSIVANYGYPHLYEKTNINTRSILYWGFVWDWNDDNFNTINEWLTIILTATETDILNHS